MTQGPQRRKEFFWDRSLPLKSFFPCISYLLSRVFFQSRTFPVAYREKGGKNRKKPEKNGKNRKNRKKPKKTEKTARHSERYESALNQPLFRAVKA
jgi:hypothetical protein